MQIFDRCVGLVFARLYERFPQRTDIDYFDLPNGLFDDSDSTLEVVAKYNIFEATVRWLHDASYIWAESVTDQKATGLVLTPKALEILKVPHALRSKQTLGDFLESSVRAGAKKLVEKGVEVVLTEALKYGTKSGGMSGL